MKKDEEKILIGLGIIGALILISATVIQISDEKANNYIFKIKQEEFVNTFGMINNDRMLSRTEFYELKEEISNVKYICNQSGGVVSVKEGELQAWLDENGTLHTKNLDEQSQDFKNLAENAMQEMIDLYEHPTIWFRIKSIFVSIQIYLIIINVLGYIYLLNKILRKKS